MQISVTHGRLTAEIESADATRTSSFFQPSQKFGLELTKGSSRASCSDPSHCDTYVARSLKHSLSARVHVLKVPAAVLLILHAKESPLGFDQASSLLSRVSGARAGGTPVAHGGAHVPGVILRLGRPRRCRAPSLRVRYRGGLRSKPGRVSAQQAGKSQGGAPAAPNIKTCPSHA